MEISFEALVTIGSGVAAASGAMGYLKGREKSAISDEKSEHALAGIHEKLMALAEALDKNMEIIRTRTHDIDAHLRNIMAQIAFLREELRDWVAGKK